MMIPTLTDYFAPGYLPRAGRGPVSPFFPNCNLAVRQKTIEQLGGYGQGYRHAAEDADLCRRAARAGWELFYADGAKCDHEPRPNLTSLIRQWYSYGYHGSLFFLEAQEYRCEVFATLAARPRIDGYRRLWKTRWSPFPVLLFLSYFPIGHVWLLALAASVWLKSGLLSALLGGGLAGFLLAIYLRSPLRRLSLKDLAVYSLVTCLINASCTIGSLAGGLRRGRLFMYPGV